MEFDKTAAASVVDRETAMDYESHQSTHHNENKEKRVITLQDCLEEFTQKEQLGKNDTWYKIIYNYQLLSIIFLKICIIFYFVLIFIIELYYFGTVILRYSDF